MLRHFFLPLLTIISLLCPACGAMLTGSTDPNTVKKVMESTHARGCIAHRNHTEQFLRSDTYVIGTWGTPSPELAECIRAWQGVLQ
jgi:predicted class III extradiol MEMO1 family dioxygenase